MRSIKGIIIHCSATKPTMDIGADEIKDWHVKGNGWSDIGYHYVIRRNGGLENGRDIKKDGAHTKGHNKGTIGICVVGGIDDNGEPKNNYTPNQWQTLENLLTTLVFQGYICSGFYIKGHNEFSSKACPSFDVQEYLNTIGLGG
jgi:hypothetical protein